MNAPEPGGPVAPAEVNTSHEEPTPASMRKLAAAVDIPPGRHGALTPYLLVDPDGYRAYYSDEDNTGPPIRVGPTFPRSRAGQRRATAFRAALEERGRR